MLSCLLVPAIIFSFVLVLLLVLHGFSKTKRQKPKQKPKRYYTKSFINCRKCSGEFEVKTKIFVKNNLIGIHVKGFCPYCKEDYSWHATGDAGQALACCVFNKEFYIVENESSEVSYVALKK